VRGIASDAIVGVAQFTVGYGAEFLLDPALSRCEEKMSDISESAQATPALTTPQE